MGSWVQARLTGALILDWVWTAAKQSLVTGRSWPAGASRPSADHRGGATEPSRMSDGTQWKREFAYDTYRTRLIVSPSQPQEAPL